MSFSSDLKLLMQVRRLRMPLLDLQDRKVFEANLCFVYHMIRASEGLLRVGQEVTKDKALREFYKAHGEEEAGHADWLEADMAVGGIASVSIPREAMMMAGVQYYLLYHVNPASLLGYMAALECFPTSLGFIEELEKLHGKALCRTMRYHAEHDIAHGAELLAFIDTRPKGEHAAIREAATQACHFMTNAVSSMREPAHG